VKFQKAFHLLPVPGDEKQNYDLVFGSPDADPDNGSSHDATSARQSRSTWGREPDASCGGYFTWDEAIALAKGTASS